jgi:hypothetical protein
MLVNAWYYGIITIVHSIASIMGYRESSSNDKNDKRNQEELRERDIVMFIGS